MRRTAWRLLVAIPVAAILNFVTAGLLCIGFARDYGEFGVTADDYPCFWVVTHAFGSLNVAHSTLQHGKRLEAGGETLTLPSVIPWDRSDWPSSVYRFAGWPLLSFHCELTRVQTPDGTDEHWVGALVLDAAHTDPSDLAVIPFRPIYPGVIINTTLFTALVLAVISLPAFVRNLHRRMRSRCVRCGYTLHGQHECPECGSKTCQGSA